MAYLIRSCKYLSSKHCCRFQTWQVGHANDLQSILQWQALKRISVRLRQAKRMNLETLVGGMARVAEKWLRLVTRKANLCTTQVRYGCCMMLLFPFRCWTRSSTSTTRWCIRRAGLGPFAPGWPKNGLQPPLRYHLETPRSRPWHHKLHAGRWGFGWMIFGWITLTEWPLERLLHALYHQSRFILVTIAPRDTGLH